MDKILKLCNLYEEKSVSLSLQQTNPKLFEALSDVRFTCNEMRKLKTIKNNEKQFAYLINKAAQVLPLLVTYAKYSMSIDNSIILGYKDVRDQANLLLEKFMEYSRPPSNEELLNELDSLLEDFCNGLDKFIDKLTKESLQEKSEKSTLEKSNPNFYQTLSDSKFICNEMKKIKTIKNNERDFSDLINEAIQVLPLLVTHAKNSIQVDKPIILEYKNVRDQASILLEKFMEYSRPPRDESLLDQLNLLFWQFCGEFGNFIDKLELYSS